MTDPVLITGELAGGLLGAIVANKTFGEAGIKYDFPISLAGGAIGSLGWSLLNNYEQSNKKYDWLLENPVTFAGLTGIYGTFFDSVVEIILPELFLVNFSRDALTLGAFGLGAYNAYLTGPTVGAAGQMVLWALAEAAGYSNFPEPSLVSDSTGISEIPSLMWNGLKDMFTIGVWKETVEPMIDAYKNSVQHGQFVPLEFFLALWRTVLIIPDAVSNAWYQLLWHIVKVGAAVLHSVKKW